MTLDNQYIWFGLIQKVSQGSITKFLHQGLSNCKGSQFNAGSSSRIAQFKLNHFGRISLNALNPVFPLPKLIHPVPILLHPKTGWIQDWTRFLYTWKGLTQSTTDPEEFNKVVQLELCNPIWILTIQRHRQSWFVRLCGRNFPRLSNIQTTQQNLVDLD